MRTPVVDTADCKDCDVCVEICPSVFRKNDMGLVQVIEADEYPEAEVDECIRNCPCQCIRWEED